MKPAHLLQYLVVFLSLFTAVYVLNVVYYRGADSQKDLAFCAIVKDQDVTEWIEYHKHKGVTKFYIFDHNSSEPLVNHLQKYVRSELVEYRTLSKRLCPTEHLRGNPQLCAYHVCLSNYGPLHKYIGFFDPDEYVVVKKQDANILDVLELYKGYGGLTLNWMMFGSSGHSKKPEGGVLSNYHSCTINEHVKTIVETKLTTSVSNMPHHFRYKWGFYAVDTNFRRIDGPWNPGLGAVPPESLYNVMYLNHYVLQSKEDYLKKIERGSGDGQRKDMAFFTQMDKTMDRDCGTIVASPQET